MKKIASIAFLWIILTSMSLQVEIPKAQAMFIYNFSRLIEWPDNYKTGPFIIGVIGSSPTGTELEAYTTGKAVGSQTIQVKKFESAAQIANCHILFVPFSKTKMLPEIMQAIGTKSILIISEKNGAIDEGVAINFITVGDKLKFEIKPSNAATKKIQLSSKLSEMAYKVY